MPHVLSTGGGQALIDPADTAILLLDHQTGLFQTVKDIGVMELRANTTALAKLGTLLKLPVITTTSVPDGPCRNLKRLHRMRTMFRVMARSTPGIMRLLSRPFATPARRR